MYIKMILFITLYTLLTYCLHISRGGILITVEGDNLDAVGDPQLVTTVLIEQKNYNETFWTVNITITKISYTIYSTINSTINSTATCGSYYDNS